MTSQALTVLFADLSGSTRLYQMQGDAKAHQSVSQSLLCMKSAIESHGGSLLRTVGDAALASFVDTNAACEAAIDIQREHGALNLPVRVGFHFGEAIPDAGDLYGQSVNLAARVAQFAEANEICTTEQAVARLSQRHRANTHYLDKVEFKGFSAPLPVYRVLWKTDTAQTAIITAVPAMDRNPSSGALVLTVNGSQQIFDGSKTVLSLGRSQDNHVIVDAESASRNHAAIELVRGRYVLTDSSTNGTYLLKGDSAPEFILRESLPLDQFGVIGLGADPLAEPEHAIEYRLIAAKR